MLYSGDSLRFTAKDMQLLHEVGIDVTAVRNRQDFEAAIKDWTGTLAVTHPAFLEKFARELAKATGVKLPAEIAAILLPSDK